MRVPVVFVVFVLVAGLAAVAPATTAGAASPVPPTWPPSQMLPLSPARLLDTRAGSTTVDGQQAGGGALASGETLDLPVLGRGGVPATGVAAVAVNVTVTGPTAAGYVTVFPTGAGRPLASNLNFTAGQTIANLVIARVGTGGKISLYNAAGTADLVVDVVGLFGAGSDYAGLTPARLLDTRPGQTTVDGLQAGGGAVGAGQTLDLPVAGRGGVPATGVAAVAVNVTVTGPTTAGFVTAYPSGTTRPLASNLNFSAGQTIPNLVVAQLGTDGNVALYNAVGNTHLVVDVVGWFSSADPGGDFTSVAPARLLDTRPGQATVDNQDEGQGPTYPGDPVNVAVLGRGGIPASGVGAVVVNVTVTDPTVAGYETTFPTGLPRPAASSLNFTPGETIPNLVIAGVGQDGQISLDVEGGRSNLVADVVGWFATPPTSDTPAGTALQVAAGAGFGPGHSCLVGSTGRVQCWGDNWYGDLGDGSDPVDEFGTGYRTEPTDVIGITDATAVAAGGDNSCALRSTGAIACWGNDDNGQLGDGGLVGTGTPVAVANITDATQVSVGPSGSCARLSTGQVACWGEVPLTTGSEPVPALPRKPVVLAGIADATWVSVYGDAACVVRAGGQVWCWGSNANGRLGDGDTTSDRSLDPVRVTGLSDATQVGVGQLSDCALESSGHVQCWGNNSYGQLGIGTGVTLDASPTPMTVTGLSDATQLTVGDVYNCVGRATGGIECWGYGEYGALGDGLDQESYGPVAVSPIAGAVQVSAATFHTCALLSGGTVDCWGADEQGELGDDAAPGSDGSGVPSGVIGYS